MANEMYKILIFTKRRPGTSREEFRDYYENRHVPLCMKYMRGAKRYFRRYIQTLTDPATGEPKELEFDAVTEVWFEDRAVFEAVLAHAGTGILPDDVVADEERLFDRSKVRFTWVIECETDMEAAAQQ